MQALPPTRTQQHREWEGGEFPPLKLKRGDCEVELRKVRGPEALFEEPVERRKSEERAKARTELSVTGPALLGKTPWTLFCVALFSVLSYFLMSRFVVTAVIIQGRSMQPTLQDGERYYLNRLHYQFAEPKRGELVVLRDPGHNDFAAKRIVAGPNDWVNMRDGFVYLNGKRLVEPYLPEGMRTFAPDMKEKWILLGPDQYYVLGDNRVNSEDSRYYGVVNRKLIQGVLIR